MSPVVPSYVPLAALLAFEGIAFLAAFFAFLHRRGGVWGSLILCSRCARLHARAEIFGRAADAAAVGALAFLAALPFVAAGYESGFSLSSTVLAASTVVALIAVVAEADFLLRTLAARLWPQFTWKAEPARIIGGGARWFGMALAMYLFQYGPGIRALFGGVGERVAIDLASTWTIYAAAAILVIAQIVALSARWLVPLVFQSLPTTLAKCREPHGIST